MAKRMLIDAAHPEETRVVVLNGNRLEEFDFESSTKKQIKGNIYLAKVTRVEPSLQAAFVEYGGNRHGFLAFNEIHPDYYRIPIADRQAALDAERAAEQAADAREDAERERYEREPRERVAAPEEHEAEPPFDEAFANQPDAHDDDDGDGGEDGAEDGGAERMAHAAPAIRLAEPESSEAAAGAVGFPADPEAPHAADDGAPNAETDAPESPLDALPWGGDEPAPAAPGEDHEDFEGGAAPSAEPAGDVRFTAPAAAHGDSIETVGGDEFEETTRPRARPYRHYKIQEVIKRRQIMLVQVTKEERGNKGAALTTYLSLAGRYCVLMPNTPRGGGVSRKITNVGDRRRLKDLMSDLDVPEGMGVIVRTAGSERSKAEIKRDFEYLLRLWEEIRDLTLKSTAPALIYEEGNLIKRVIRDLYARDIDDVVVDGEEGYRTAKTFMKMLMPSHAKRVKLYRDPTVPLFHRHQVEPQIDAIHSPVVQLRSGGYIVINPTEALVAIDVNSGRSTKERNIEETALKTNIEAAEEIARQLRLRDLAGLIVIDFIDMEEYRNRGSVERKLKEAMRYDRARIQLGRISPFGLLELSRQRLRPSLVEASSQPCPYCAGSGHIRSIESTALHVLRAIEEEGMRRRSAEIGVAVPSKVALYILNQKRAALQLAEARFGIKVMIGNDDTLVPPAFRIDRVRALTPAEVAALPSFVAPPEIEEEEDEDLLLEDEETANADPSPPPQPQPERSAERGPDRGAERSDEGDKGDTSRSRHRRRRRPRHEEARDRAPAASRQPPPIAAENEDGEAAEQAEDVPAGQQAPPQEPREARPDGSPASEAERRRRRRGRRGGRRRRHDEPARADQTTAGATEPFGMEEIEIVAAEDATEAETIELIPPSPEQDEPEREIAAAFSATPAPPETGDDTASVPIADGAVAGLEPADAPPSAQPPEPSAPAANPRRGWWRR